MTKTLRKKSDGVKDVNLCREQLLMCHCIHGSGQITLRYILMLIMLDHSEGNVSGRL